ncbi:Zinc finger, LIM-type [Cynara cardunculus var. scolymus]|uniref:Zinc finger, LIM-type n=1 Tax=Cynara cardunculus var. scolymus TaxID=59895 RepID=A0A103XI01_CYNCS|nr:Zinc finger, LIM-type [Cynara cardunculus var. scolymus]
MGFAGTVDRCNACNKVVHFIDYMTVDGVIYHKSCTTTPPWMESYIASPISNNYSKKLEISARIFVHARAPHKFASFFTGTQDKCPACHKTVYPLEQITMEGEPYHKRCFRCAYRGCPLTHSSYAAHNSVLYCRHHFSQLFMEKGDFAHVLKAANRKNNENEQAEKAPEDETKQASDE